MTVAIRLARQPYAATGMAFLWAAGLLFLVGPLRGSDGWFAWQVATGVPLAGGMVWQWLLLVARLGGQAREVRRQYHWHRYIGTALVALFAAHAIRFGHGWTSALSAVFLAAAISGLLNREILAYRARWAHNLWLFLHVASASALVPLALLHIWVALAFE